MRDIEAIEVSQPAPRAEIDDLYLHRLPIAPSLSSNKKRKAFRCKCKKNGRKTA
jgi:hypothetical protein